MNAHEQERMWSTRYRDAGEDYVFGTTANRFLAAQSALLGSGRTETAEVMFGWKPADSGTIEIDGRAAALNSPPAAIAEGFGCYGEYVDKDEDIAPAIKRAYASGKVGVIHVAIDPKANSEEMPSYDEFRTWYAEGQQ